LEMLIEVKGGISLA